MPQVDVAIVEAGLGGARDATNVFTSETLKLAIITAIGLEHQKALGATLREISAAKAGVLKQGRPVVVSRQPEAEALQELLKTASNQSCTVVHPTSTVHLQAQVKLWHLWIECTSFVPVWDWLANVEHYVVNRESLSWTAG
jgi:folylpolyglutamate synthase/dihydropteroate synthase